MGLSETILAAMIGAIATVTTALFNLFMAFKARSKIDPRPRRGSTARSVLAVLALMVASAAGGFLYSEFLKERSGEDLRAMRQELKELKELTASAARLRDEASTRMQAAASSPRQDLPMIPVGLESGDSSVESVVYVPACRRHDAGAGCEETDAQRIALCGTIPGYARVDDIELFVQPHAVQHPWEQHRVAFEQDLGGARFTGHSFEYAQGQDFKAVCVNFMQWSSERPHIARIVVQYGFGEPTPRQMLTPVMIDASPVQTPAVIAADSMPATPQPAAFGPSVSPVGDSAASRAQ